jgi:F-type H+-transporting ATPase subunit c
MDLNVLFGVGAGIAVLTCLGAGVGIGVATAGLLGAISRQPEATGKFIPWFFVGVALSEATAVYGLVFALMLFGKLN